ncbi:hypothetical protein WICPIJ_003235 [Wickerhamomyces pijperi]|uniref:Uncharacterized protein n=1 Tax=Wickerhamomyces pijperi TaxID=599730 RepID=A0A9P8Q7F1_WICPI|nr:hypothetical protein WICPIJ_003235 [Wickerhamomyces pijperi]
MFAGAPSDLICNSISRAVAMSDFKEKKWMYELYELRVLSFNVLEFKGWNRFLSIFGITPLNLEEFL